MRQKKFSTKSRIQSFSFALNGLKIMIREEQNARIHLAVAIFISIVGFLLKLSIFEWISIVFSIGLVISLELINSAIEYMADFIYPGKNETIKSIKDVSAASVLVGSITALVIGWIVFIPKIWAIWKTFI